MSEFNFSRALRPFAIAALMVAGPAVHAEVTEEGRKNVMAALTAAVPDADIRSISESGLPGLYEVVVGANVVYISEDGRYFVQGDLIDLTSRANVTENRRLEARAEVLANLPTEETISFGSDSARHVLYVFTDIDCGYCRRMHQEVDQLVDAGIAVRYLSFPRSGVGSESYDKFVSVHCNEDRQQALTDAKAGKTVPTATCDNPVEAQFKLGESMGVQGTPAVFLQNGQEIGGYIPAERLIEYFKRQDEAAS